MESTPSLFEMFGGVRPMARAIREAPSNVASWKRAGRIPPDKQRSVLEVGEELGLQITAEHVVFPLGRPAAAAPSEIAAQSDSVCFGRSAKLKREGQA
ncbi:carph-isopro domain-containing protein [Sphingobium sp. B2D3B]|uniref:carph-isopro domain-containing protein n=1 Tax=Sphingobium sp. B2D3B TaxID=2940580 RepID=UPI0039B6AEF1